jgi:hypothetical protein
MPKSLLAALALALVLAAPAGATQSDKVSFAPPKGGRQLLTITLSDDVGGDAAVVSATYRHVPSSTTQTTGACAATLAANRDARLIDGVAVGPAPWTVARSVSLPLGLYAACTYHGQSLSGVVVGGSFTTGGSPGARRPTAVSLGVLRTGARARFTGATAGTRTGRVALQRRVGRRWRTVGHATVRRARFARTLSARRGQRWRAVLQGDRRHAPSASRTVRLR